MRLTSLRVIGARPLFIERRLKNSLRCALVVASFTSRQLRRMYSWISALIQWMANDTRRTLRSGSKRFTAFIRPIVAFLDQVGVRQAVAEVAARDRDHQPQVRQHELARRIEVVVLAQAQRERALLFRASASGSG